MQVLKIYQEKVTLFTRNFTLTFDSEFQTDFLFSFYFERTNCKFTTWKDEKARASANYFPFCKRLPNGVSTPLHFSFHLNRILSWLKDSHSLLPFTIERARSRAWNNNGACPAFFFPLRFCCQRIFSFYVKKRKKGDSILKGWSERGKLPVTWEVGRYFRANREEAVILKTDLKKYRTRNSLKLIRKIYLSLNNLVDICIAFVVAQTRPRNFENCRQILFKVIMIILKNFPNWS